MWLRCRTTSETSNKVSPTGMHLLTSRARRAEKHRQDPRHRPAIQPDAALVAREHTTDRACGLHRLVRRVEPDVEPFDRFPQLGRGRREDVARHRANFEKRLHDVVSDIREVLAHRGEVTIALDHVQVWTANAGATVKDGRTRLSTLVEYGSGLRTGTNNNQHVPDHVRVDASLSPLL